MPIKLLTAISGNPAEQLCAMKAVPDEHALAGESNLLVRSFPPIEDTNARILILGSMPGKKSLLAGQYYAHPRNAFWPIMGELLGATTTLPYESRTQLLKSAGIALWDVLASCTRESSLDSDIDAARANDFESFFLTHPEITRVFFNGAIAEKYFQTLVRRLLEPRLLRYRRLPSTSPAHAAMPYQQKLDSWKLVLQKQLKPEP